MSIFEKIKVIGWGYDNWECVYSLNLEDVLIIIEGIAIISLIIKITLMSKKSKKQEKDIEELKSRNNNTPE